MVIAVVVVIAVVIYSTRVAIISCSDGKSRHPTAVNAASLASRKETPAVACVTACVTHMLTYTQGPERGRGWRRRVGHVYS